jgi:hypothetical protein
MGPHEGTVYTHQSHSWPVVSVQRSLYKRIEDGTGKSNITLTSERIQKLNAIDFEWVARDHRTVPWEARYQELVAFVRRYGHSQVPIGWEVRTTSDPIVDAEQARVFPLTVTDLVCL